MILYSNVFEVNCTFDLISFIYLTIRTKITSHQTKLYKTMVRGTAKANKLLKLKRVRLLLKTLIRPKIKIVVLPLNGKIRNFGRSVGIFYFFIFFFF